MSLGGIGVPFMHWKKEFILSVLGGGVGRVVKDLCKASWYVREVWSFQREILAEVLHSFSTISYSFLIFWGRWGGGGRTSWEGGREVRTNRL